MCKRTVYTEIVDAILITSNIKDFDGDNEKWRRAYFELLSWKNTWGFPLKMDMYSNRDHYPFVDIVLKDDNPYVDSESVTSWMEDLGYGNIKTTKIKVMLIEPPYDENEAVSDYVFDY